MSRDDLKVSAHFPKSRRVLRRRDFLRIQGSHRKVRSPHFILALSTPSLPAVDNAPHARLGVTITTKVDKKAVNRNRLRRRIRELFRVHIGNPSELTEMVVIALDGATALSFDEVRGELCMLAKKAKLDPLLVGCGALYS